jgi:SAM-dependent methyltransferase
MKEIPAGPWLNLGCGADNPAGWINVDGSWQALLAGRPWGRLVARMAGRSVGHWPRGIVHRDLRRGLGWGPGSVAVVYSSHLLEHLYRDQALRLVSQIHAALHPGGVCRVVVPDAAAIVGWYLDNRDGCPEERRRASDLLMELLGMRPATAPAGRGLLAWYRRATDLDQHKWMYDAEGLCHLFTEAGFVDPAVRTFLDSVLPAERLAAVEKASRIEDGAGVCVEARR